MIRKYFNVICQLSFPGEYAVTTERHWAEKKQKAKNKKQNKENVYIGSKNTNPFVKKVMSIVIYTRLPLHLTIVQIEALKQAQ